MRPKATVVLGCFAIVVCAMAPPDAAAQTSWGKANVPFADYRLDSGQCAVEASRAAADWQDTAGGLGSGVATGEDAMLRASNQARAQRRADQRAQQRALEDCLTARGYREFRLTREQRAHLNALPEGGEERRAYLHGLGADPAILAAQAVERGR